MHVGCTARVQVKCRGDIFVHVGCTARVASVLHRQGSKCVADILVHVCCTARVACVLRRRVVPSGCKCVAYHIKALE